MGLTKPDRVVYPGEPAFKTQKQLGERALASDTFSSPRSYYNTGQEAGMGQYAHRDGYNVLYGDGSARWRGDPQLNILWYDIGKSVAGGTYGTFQATLAHNCIGSWKNASGAGGMSEKSAVNIWHEFDTANGVDTGLE